MPPRPISRRLHGAFDLLGGATLVAAAPTALGLNGTRAGRILRAAGATHLTLGALTRYETGVVKVVPFRAHLMTDAAAGLGLAAAPWLFGTAKEGRRHWLPLVALGVFEVAAAALTQPREADEPAGDAPPQSTGVDTGMPSPTAVPDPDETVMPDGAEAAAEMGARTVGGDR